MLVTNFRKAVCIFVGVIDISKGLGVVDICGTDHQVNQFLVPMQFMAYVKSASWFLSVNVVLFSEVYYNVQACV